MLHDVGACATVRQFLCYDAIDFIQVAANGDPISAVGEFARLDNPEIDLLLLPLLTIVRAEVYILGVLELLKLLRSPIVVLNEL